MSDALRIRQEYPPNIKAIEARFGARVRNGTVIFTYTPFVYVPSGNQLSPPLEAHERVHLEQQGRNPAVWWDLYLHDVDFRLTQELPAHRAEWQVWKATHKGREKRRFALRGISTRLASPLYGTMMTYKRARRAILR